MESVKREPVMKLEAERLWGGAGEYAVSFEKAGWLDECRRKGGTFLLYTQPDWARFSADTRSKSALQCRISGLMSWSKQWSESATTVSPSRVKRSA